MHWINLSLVDDAIGFLRHIHCIVIYPMDDCFVY